MICESARHASSQMETQNAERAYCIPETRTQNARTAHMHCWRDPNETCRCSLWQPTKPVSYAARDHQTVWCSLDFTVCAHYYPEVGAVHVEEAVFDDETGKTNTVHVWLNREEVKSILGLFPEPVGNPEQLPPRKERATESSPCGTEAQVRYGEPGYQSDYEKWLASHSESDAEGLVEGTDDNMDPHTDTADVSGTKVTSAVHKYRCSHRIGTVYKDEETGEYVMPADFIGDEELRWTDEQSSTVAKESLPTDCQSVPVKHQNPIPSANEMTVTSCPTCGTVTDIDYGIFTESPFSVRSENGEVGVAVAPSVVARSGAGSSPVPPSIHLAHQVDIFAHYAREALDMLPGYIKERGAVLTDAEMERMRTLGVDEYGDGTFHLTIDQLHRELCDELCDATFYAAVLCWQMDKLRNGVL